MILLEDRRTTSNLNGKRFKFKINEISFKVIIDSLYKDNINAIIRELASNAHDSHIKAKTNKPFDLILPTELNNILIIRDYGTGLSKNQIETLYSTFFDSNKRNSNDYIGYFGLGSKSPFGISDSFFITSYYKNKELNYIAYLDNNLPKISFLNSKETNKENAENGLEIKIPIKDGYKNKIDLSNLEYFNINIINGKINKQKILYEFDDIFFIDSDESYIIQKPLKYKIELIDNKELNLLLKSGFCINSKIGQFNISAKRDSIKLSEKLLYDYYVKIKEHFSKINIKTIDEYLKYKNIIKNFKFDIDLKFNFNITLDFYNYNIKSIININELKDYKIFVYKKKGYLKKIKSLYPFDNKFYTIKYFDGIEKLFNDFILI